MIHILNQPDPESALVHNSFALTVCWHSSSLMQVLNWRIGSYISSRLATLQKKTKSGKWKWKLATPKTVSLLLHTDLDNFLRSNRGRQRAAFVASYVIMSTMLQFHSRRTSFQKYPSYKLNSSTADRHQYTRYRGSYRYSINSLAFSAKQVKFSRLHRNKFIYWATEMTLVKKLHTTRFLRRPVE